MPLKALKTVVEQEEEQGEEQGEEQEEEQEEERKGRSRPRRPCRPLIRNPNWEYRSVLHDIMI